MSADVVNIISILKEEKNILSDVSFYDQWFIGHVLFSGIYGMKELSVLLLPLNGMFIHGMFIHTNHTLRLIFQSQQNWEFFWFWIYELLGEKW